MRFTVSKKGVSPLISTVLLIAFAVALGAIVMNWGSTYVKGQTAISEKSSDEDIACSRDVSLEIVKVDGINKICYNDAQDLIQAVLQNNGRKKIDSILVNIVGNLSVPPTQMMNITLDVGYVAQTNVTYDNATYGYIRKIIYTPKIKVGEISVVCTKNSYSKELVDGC